MHAGGWVEEERCEGGREGRREERGIHHNRHECSLVLASDPLLLLIQAGWLGEECLDPAQLSDATTRGLGRLLFLCVCELFVSVSLNVSFKSVRLFFLCFYVCIFMRGVLSMHMYIYKCPYFLYVSSLHAFYVCVSVCIFF